MSGFYFDLIIRLLVLIHNENKSIMSALIPKNDFKEWEKGVNEAFDECLLKAKTVEDDCK